jgi:hypothetical protein
MKWLAKALKVELTWRNFPDLEQLERPRATAKSTSPRA